MLAILGVGIPPLTVLVRAACDSLRGPSQVLSYAELIEPHPELKPSQDRVVYKEAIFTDIDTQI